MSEIVEKILSNYAGESPAVIGNLRGMLNTGTLAGTGKLVILPVDQGFEHGPGRTFEPNPAGYDPFYHTHLTMKSRYNTYTTPLNALEMIAHHYTDKLPLILKINNNNPGQPAHDQTVFRHRRHPWHGRPVTHHP